MMQLRESHQLTAELWCNKCGDNVAHDSSNAAEQGVLRILSDLRRQGLTRSSYNLASPYGASKRFIEAEQRHLRL